MSFKHGVETIELTTGIVPVTVVRSGVIGLVGISPKKAANELFIVRNQTDAAAFGEELPGFSIPQALRHILNQGAGTVIVVNVFDNTDHTTTVTAETLTAVANRKTKMAFAHVGDATFVLTNSAGSTTYTLNTDYTVDDFGNITILAAIGTIAEGAVLKATYEKLDTAAITATEINGANTGGVRTGMKCFIDSYNTFGFRPKILIAPGYSTINAVAAQMIVEADYYKAVALIDAPTGTDVDEAIAARGVAGTLNFKTSSDRAILLEPGNLYAYDKATNTNILYPFSSFMAGVMANSDNVNGYWYSPSNKIIKGALGSEIKISAAINDFTTEANALNEIGICTVYNSGSSGLRTWGNRSAAYPSVTHPRNFINIRRTTDVVHESIELAQLDFVDQPLNDAVIDSVRGTVQAFINTLIGRGAMYPGSEILYLTDRNSSTDLAAGKATWTLRHAIPPPLEHMVFESYYDIDLVTITV